MILVGPMQLHQPQPLDPMEPFFNGTQSDGGYWLDMSRLSAHNHTGGLNGAPVSAVIPPGSITSGQLDPSVLAPYALTDGSKPFTGQVTMQADAVVRDALFFGEQGTALAPDVTLARTGAGALRVDTHLGVGVNANNWRTDYRALQVGYTGVLAAGTLTTDVELVSNCYFDPGGSNLAIQTGAGAIVQLNAGSITMRTAPSVAAGAAQTFTTRASIAPTGTLSLAPDAGVDALVADTGTGSSLTVRRGESALNAVQLVSPAWLEIRAGALSPMPDNAVSLGHPAFRYTQLCSVAGTINTSSQEFKEGITPLDPARAMQAVRDTEAVSFDYVAPTRGPEWYDLPDDPEQAEAVLQQRLTAAPLEAAARHQHGFIAEDCDPLFLVGEGQTSPGSSIGVLLAALQNIDQRLAALETP